MRLDRWLALQLFVCALSYPQLSSAWGSIGHRVVGQIADAHLKGPARTAVSSIMNDSSLGRVANWMDTVRGSTEWGFMDDWHFQTIDSCKPEAAFCPGNNCAGRRIIETIGKLEQYAAMKKKSKQAKREELTALSVLVHLLGDIHQPLHTSENADIGGNAVTITNRKQCFDRDGNLIFCKLHSYWDTNLVQAAMGKQTEKALVLELAKMTVDTGGDAESWIKESNALAKQKVRTYNGFTCTAFTPPDPVTGKKHVVPTKITITKGYDDAAKPIVKEQLAKAGQRLAAILNEIYK